VNDRKQKPATAPGIENPADAGFLCVLDRLPISAVSRELKPGHSLRQQRTFTGQGKVENIYSLRPLFHEHDARQAAWTKPAGEQLSPGVQP
jgi:hypothetical protein